MTYGLESSGLRTIIGRSIIDSHAPNFTVEISVGDLRNTFVGSVAGFEIHIGGPVIRQILAKTA